MKWYSFCVFVCALVIIHAWVLNGSAVLHGWVNTYLPHNYTFFFLLSLLSFICLGSLWSDIFVTGSPSPTPAPSFSITQTLFPITLWYDGQDEKGPFFDHTNQHSHDKEQRAKGTNNNMLWLKAQVLLVGLPRGLGPLCSCTACSYCSRLEIKWQWVDSKMTGRDAGCCRQEASIKSSYI